VWKEWFERSLRMWNEWAQPSVWLRSERTQWSVRVRNERIERSLRLRMEWDGGSRYWEVMSVVPPHLRKWFSRGQSVLRHLSKRLASERQSVEKRLTEQVWGSHSEADWDYLSTNPDGLTVRGKGGPIDPSEEDAMRGRVRDMLAHVFGQVSDELHAAVERRVRQPLDRLELYGSEATRLPYGSRLMRFVRLRPDVSANIHRLAWAKERWASAVLLEGSDSQEGIDLVVPIGHYGPPLALALLQAARAMDAIAVSDLEQSADALTKKYDRLLNDWTTQTTALRSTLAGISTFAGVAGLLTYHAVPGMSALALLDAIEEGLLFDRLAKAPVAVLGPMFFYGLVPRPAVRMIDERKRLVLSAPLERILRDTKFIDSSWIVPPAQGRPTHKGCPIALRHLPITAADGTTVANPETYVTTLGRDYLQLARRFYTEGAA
jgi:hypothetical protein